MTASAIYLDHAATTPLHPLVLEAMMPYFGQNFGNPSSLHSFGREAKAALDQARDTVAAALNCQSGQLIFTSSGTESDNLALFGTVMAGNGDKRHIITTQIEHHAVLRVCQQLERSGYDVTYLPVDEHGQVRLSDVETAIRPDTALISIMYANNEVGTLQPVEQIGALARERGVIFHTDAVQAFGMIPIDLQRLPIDLLTISSHKLNGPKGNGALYVGKRVVLAQRMFGGSQERNRRAGTEDVAGIAGFAKAVQLSTTDIVGKRETMQSCRNEMLGFLDKLLGSAHFAVNGHPTAYVPHILNVSLLGTETETMLMKLDLAGIAASGGSACTSGSLEPSHVLSAMGLPESRTRSAVRFSFGYGNTFEQIATVSEKIATFSKQIRIK